MIDYRAGNWGFHVAFNHCIDGSLVPKALTMAIPNAVLTFVIATLVQQRGADDFEGGIVTIFHEDTASAASMAVGAFTVVMTFILQRRSSIAYDRWWEGGTLLQKTRGEWFNAYSSILAFTSTKPEMQEQVEEYLHLLARLMSLLMCCGLQQVSPNWDRPFEILELHGIEPESLEFLNSAPDKVEIILQWIQRSMVLHAQSGVLPVAPPILSRAFQEFSRGIVNLQNARKIADFPYPYPLAQISMVLQMVHWCMMPLAAALAVPRMWAVLLSFFSIFVLWCIHFNAIELEFPFGTRTNDLPMNQMQHDWNHSVRTLLNEKATRPPGFVFDPTHTELNFVMSDASAPTTLTGGGPRSRRKSVSRNTASKEEMNIILNEINQRSALATSEDSGGVSAAGTTFRAVKAEVEEIQLQLNSTAIPSTGLATSSAALEQIQSIQANAKSTNGESRERELSADQTESRNSSKDAASRRGKLDTNSQERANGQSDTAAISRSAAPIIDDATNGGKTSNSAATTTPPSSSDTSDAVYI